MNDPEFKQILQTFGYSWDGYRRVRKGVKKRLRSEMKQQGAGSTAAYIDCLRKDNLARHRFERQMTVSISRFFRDQALWGLMEEMIMPEIMRRFPSPFSAWVVGCAGGEEVYSIQILLEMIQEKQGESLPRSILATDMNPACLHRARQGVYPRSSFRETPVDICRRFFHAGEKKRKFTVPAFLKKDIIWDFRDITQGPLPDEKFHVILLRNSVFTYHEPFTGQRVLKRVLTRLVPDGYLVIGKKENIPSGFPFLKADAVCPFVYRYSRDGGESSPVG